MSLLFLLPDLQRFLKVLKVQNDGTHGWNLCQPDMGVAKPNINPKASGLRSLNRVYIHVVESLNIPPIFKKVNGALLEVGEGCDRSQNLRNFKDKIVLGARFHIVSPKKIKSKKPVFFLAVPSSRASLKVFQKELVIPTGFKNSGPSIPNNRKKPHEKILSGSRYIWEKV